MGTRWGTVVVDSLDPNRLARWWAEVLDYQVLREAVGEVTIGRDGDGPRLVFIRVPDGKSEKNRLHLELHPEHQDAEVERLLDMGARRADVGQPQDAGWVVLADPEGNEFCVLPGGAQAEPGFGGAEHP
jgi:catechol-2,3-dioxygenase